MVLTAKQRRALTLARLGKPQAEIAELLGVRRESINRLLSRAGRRVEAFVGKCGGGDACPVLEALLT